MNTGRIGCAMEHNERKCLLALRIGQRLLEQILAGDIGRAQRAPVVGIQHQADEDGAFGRVDDVVEVGVALEMGYVLEAGDIGAVEDLMRLEHGRLSIVDARGIDAHGVEVALQLAEEIGEDATVTLVSMSPSGSLQGIRQALAMGADKAVIVDDPNLKGEMRVAVTFRKVSVGTEIDIVQDGIPDVAAPDGKSFAYALFQITAAYHCPL